MNSHVIGLPVDELPRSWYNIVPDLPEPLPPAIDPEGGPSALESLPDILTKTSIELDNSNAREIPIPDEVWDLYQHIGRPRPLYRARRLEEYLKTPARIYFKREDLAPTGSYKMNTAIPQVYYAMKEGYKRIASETGAGQNGSAFAYAASLLGLNIRIYWVRHACRLKAERVSFTRLMGAEVFESPSPHTSVGRRLYEKDPQHPGDIGIAIGEALEDAMGREDTIGIRGSTNRHVLLHQSIIGLETQKQLELVDERPTIMVSCIGGGANFTGFVSPFVREHLKGHLDDVRFVGAEPEASPRLTTGEYRYDSHAERMPLEMIYTLGRDTPLPTIRAEGIRAHTVASITSLLRHKGLVETMVYPKDEVDVFEAARQLLRVEGVLVAPESAYSVRAAIDLALEAKRKGKEEVIVFNISGSGYFDLKAYREVLPDIASS